MKDKLDELQDACESMVKLLQDRHEGLGSWWSVMGQAADRIRSALPPKSSD